MNTKHRLLPALLGSATSLILASAAHASLYTNQIGPNLSYTNINEFDSQISGPPPVTSNPTGLFGAPALDPVGSDNLSFPTTTFNVQVADGQFEEQDGKLTLDITPTQPGSSIDTLDFDESGSFRVQGPSGADATSVEASLIFSNLQITSVNNVALTTPIVVHPTIVTGAAPAGPANVSINSSGETGDVVITSDDGSAVGTWKINANFNLDAALADNQLTGDVTGVSVALDDDLVGETTASDSLTLGTIDKKSFEITGTVPNPVSGPGGPGVPEPTTLSLLVGTAALAMRRRSREI
jgi:hypothetical protein